MDLLMDRYQLLSFQVGQAESTMLLRIEHSPVVIHQHNKVQLI